MEWSAKAATALASCLSWYIIRRPRFRWSRQDNQANRALAYSGALGQLYFGTLMGVGILTQMSTPLVYASLLGAASEGVAWALVAGVGFGLGRSMPAVAGAAVGEYASNPHSLYLALTRPRRTARTIGAGLAALCLFTILVAG